MPTYGSLFAGVGGFDIGFDNAGWECGFQVEWDKHCQQVLTHHWPEVPKWWDVSEVNGAELPPVDLITFGSPCQDLSLAGKRAGLMEGSRSNLFFEATRIIKEMRDATNGQYPRWAIWENVAGAFSSNKGADFDAVLQEMVDIGGHHVEWHCMDAQFYGVPQRRRRVFVIACFNSSILERGGEALLPVGEGRRRNTSARNKERKALASTLGESFDSGSGRLDQRVEAELPWAAGSTDDDVLTTSVTSKWHKGTGGPSGSEHYNLVVEPMLIDGTRVDDVRIYESPVQTLMSRMGTGGNNVPMVAVDEQPVLMRQHEGKPGGGKGPLLSDTSLTLAGSNDQVLFQPSAIGFSHTQGLDAQPSEETFPTLRVGGAGQAVAIPIDDVREIEKHQNGTGIGNAGDPAYTLDTMSASGVAVSYTPTSFAQYTEGVGTLKANGGDLGGGSESLIVETDIAPTLRSGGDGGVPSSRGEHLVVEAYDEYNDALGGPVHQALRAGTKQSTGVLADMVVRRLTPVECERLMGWPDNHTLYRADGTTNSDTTRYKMCGNGVASPVAQWIAEHLLEFHTAL
jgi:DNA (cytosine-5)-methyltransferase 1